MGDEHPDNTKLSVPNDFKGPGDERHCTDCLCLPLIAAMWFAMTVVGFIVCGVIPSADLPAGNPARLTHGVDYDGNVCGVDSSVSNKAFTYYLSSGSAICVKKCPKETSYTAFVCEYEYQAEASASVARGYYYTSKEKCIYEIATKAVGFYCVYSAALDKASEASTSGVWGNITSLGYGDADDDQSAWDQFVADLMTVWWVILVFGFIVTMVMAFVYLRLLRIPGILDLLIWGIIIAVFLLLILIGALAALYTAPRWAAEEKPRSHTATEIMMVKIFGYIFLGISTAWLCFICCMRKRILLAIGITKEAARALGSMTLLVFFPLVQGLGVLAFCCVWFVYLLYLASSGEIVTEKYTTSSDQEVEYKTFEYTQNSR